MTPPRTIAQDPFRVEDDTWIDPPTSLAGRAHPGPQAEAEGYWSGLRDDRVMWQRCVTCRRFTHFPVDGCQWCGGAVVLEEVDARGTINTFSVCYMPFGFGMEAPYVVAIVNPLCEPDLQVMTDIVNCKISDVRVDLPVRPRIVHDGDTALLFYEPETQGSTP